MMRCNPGKEVRFLAWLAAVATAGCSGGGAAPGGVSEDASDRDPFAWFDSGPTHEIQIVRDAGTESSLPPVVSDPGISLDTVHDTSPSDSPDSKSGPSNGFGAPCLSPADCESDLCLDTGAGSVCTLLCADECPAGWVCRGTPISGSDPMFVCVPMYWAICKPCDSDGDCKTDLGVCKDMGPDGARCVIPCATNEDCPDGFRCETQADGGPLCIPQTHSCACKSADDAGKMRACAVVNEFGSCQGEQECDGESGWKPCEGPEPRAEECNGEDDDCDGQTDEGFPDQDTDDAADCVDPDVDGDGMQNEGDNCPTVTNADQADLDGDGQGDACDDDADGDGHAAEVDCNDKVPAIHPGATEECDLVDQDCDGLVDEGFPDTDSDGEKDCIDPDDDNDGKEDGQDNCPLVVNPDQADLDGDDIGNPCDPDVDGDLVPNASDNCTVTSNPDQGDLDQDDQGDACDPDDDGDGVPDEMDNCVGVPNALQIDTDMDSMGDACDSDDDNDAQNDSQDNCPLVANSDQEDCDGDGPGDACDPDDDNDGTPDEPDCADCDASVYPGAIEACNGVDDDCDGQADDGAAAECHPYACAGALGCMDTCDVTWPCQAGWFCDANDYDKDGRTGECLPLLPGGATCTSSFECADGWCGNGHCCGVPGEVCCASDDDCASLDTSPVCDAPATCAGHHMDGWCNAANVCKASQVDDPTGCTGSLCRAGRYCIGTTVHEDIFCGSGGACDQDGPQVQNCQGINACCDYGCSAGACWSAFRTSDLGCVLACLYEPLLCLCW